MDSSESTGVLAAHPLFARLLETSGDTDGAPEFFAQIAATATDSAITRFVAEANDEELQAFELIMTNESNQFTAIARLLETSQLFTRILTEELKALESEMGEL